MQVIDNAPADATLPGVEVCGTGAAALALGVNPGFAAAAVNLACAPLWGSTPPSLSIPALRCDLTRPISFRTVRSWNRSCGRGGGLGGESGGESGGGGRKGGEGGHG